MKLNRALFQTIANAQTNYIADTQAYCYLLKLNRTLTLTGFLSKSKNDIANQFGHNVFYNNVLIRVFYYLLEKRINTRILFLMTTYRRVLACLGGVSVCQLSFAMGSSPGLSSTEYTAIYVECCNPITIL